MQRVVFRLGSTSQKQSKCTVPRKSNHSYGVPKYSPRVPQIRAFSSSSGSTFSPTFEHCPPIDAGSLIRKSLSLWKEVYHSSVTNVLSEARPCISRRMLLGTEDGSLQTELAKAPHQSRSSIIYNFSDDNILREQYTDPCNEIQIGKLLEDLDALAG